MTVDIAPILESWDKVSGAIDATLTAQPHQMSEAAQRLATAREDFREMVRQCMRKR